MHEEPSTIPPTHLEAVYVWVWKSEKDGSSPSVGRSETSRSPWQRDNPVGCPHSQRQARDFNLPLTGNACHGQPALHALLPFGDVAGGGAHSLCQMSMPLYMCQQHAQARSDSWCFLMRFLTMYAVYCEAVCVSVLQERIWRLSMR
jgi:hypothetical protein